MLYQRFSKIKLRPLVLGSLSRGFESKATTTTCPHQEVTSEDVDWDMLGPSRFDVFREFLAGENSIDWSDARSYDEIPGPTKYQLFRRFMPGGEYYQKPFTDYILKARRQYGDLFRIPGVFGKQDSVMSFNVDDFQKVFRTEGIWPRRPGMDSLTYYRKTYRSDLYSKAEGLGNSCGESWGNFRTAVNPVLMQPKNIRSYIIPMQQVNSEFIARIREIRDPISHEVPGNFLEEINRLTFESVAVVALNKQLGLIRKNRDRGDVKRMFTSLQNLFRLIYDLDFQPSVWKYVWTPTFQKYKDSLDVISEITTGFVEEALKQYEDENRAALDDSELSVLEKLIKIDKSIAIVMAVDMLMAGVDTTTTSMTGILLQLAKNPDKQAKLRKEIRQVLPQKDSMFTVDSMKNLPYLRACIKEGIRMHPIGPGILRSAGEDITLRGYQIPKGTQVLLNSNLLLRDEKYFSNPNEFIPERWIRNEALENAIVPFSYIPFGFGARMCVGRRIVDLELEVTIGRLVRNFNIEFNYSIENAFKSYFINTPSIPLKFKFTEMES